MPGNIKILRGSNAGEPSISGVYGQPYFDGKDLYICDAATIWHKPYTSCEFKADTSGVISVSLPYNIIAGPITLKDSSEYSICILDVNTSPRPNYTIFDVTSDYDPAYGYNLVCFMGYSSSGIIISRMAKKEFQQSTGTVPLLLRTLEYSNIVS